MIGICLAPSQTINSPRLVLPMLIGSDSGGFQAGPFMSYLKIPKIKPQLNLQHAKHVLCHQAIAFHYNIIPYHVFLAIFPALSLDA